MKRLSLIALFALFALMLALPAAARSPFDPPFDSSRIATPVAVPQQFLLGAGLYVPEPGSARIVPPNAWSLDLQLSSANTFSKSTAISQALASRMLGDETSPEQIIEELRPYGQQFLVDGQLERATLTVRRGLGHGTEFRVEAPLVAINGGWADKIIENFHDSFSLGDDGRPNLPRNRQVVWLKTGRYEVLRLDKSKHGLGDIAVGMRHVFASSPGGARQFAIDGSIELPTGDKSSLVGSGKIDGALQLIASSSYRWGSLHASVGMIHLGGSELLAMDSVTVGTATLTGARLITPDWSVVAQLSAMDSPYDSLQFPELAAPVMQLTVGMQHALPGGRAVQFAVVENLRYHENTADVGLLVGVTQKIGY